MKNNIRYAVKKKSTQKIHGSREGGALVEGRKEEEGGVEPEGIAWKSLLNIAIFWEYFLVMH